MESMGREAEGGMDRWRANSIEGVPVGSLDGTCLLEHRPRLSDEVGFRVSVALFSSGIIDEA